MGTRSTIALEFADGTVKQVYCHWDGYLSHNGKLLAEYYMDPFKVKTLVELGGLSSLAPEIGEKHPFSKFESGTDQEVAAFEAVKEKGWSTFYTRDRGEELRINCFSSVDEYMREGQEEEYDYILRNVNGVATWYVKSDGRFDRMQLTEALAAEAKLKELA